MRSFASLFGTRRVRIPATTEHRQHRTATTTLFLHREQQLRPPLIMAHGFSDYLTDLSDVIINQQGPQLAYLLRPTGPHAENLLKDIRNPTVCIQSKVVQAYIDGDYSSDKGYLRTKGR